MEVYLKIYGFIKMGWGCMNLQQLRYVVEIEKTRSITAASKKLFMGQPNLSKSIKELETELGVTLFHRTPQGMEPTTAGNQFLRYAKNILRQMQELEALYHPRQSDIKLSVSVPRATYVASTFADFLSQIDRQKALDIQFRETNSMDTIHDVADGDCELGIVRFQETYSDYFTTLFHQNQLDFEIISQFKMWVLMNHSHPLTQLNEIPFQALAGYTQILHGDQQLPEHIPEFSTPNEDNRRIYVYDRGSQFDILRKVYGSYLWVSPLPEKELKRYGLKQLPCPNAGINCDVAIWRKNETLSPLAQQLIQNLKNCISSLISHSVV